LNTVDLVFLVILLFGAYKGYQRGFLLEIVSIVAFVLAVIGGFKLLDLGIDFLNSFENTLGNFLPIAAFILVFVIILLVVNIVGRIFKKIIDFTIFGNVDNFAGALLGIFKIALFLSIANWIILNLGAHLPERISKDSFIYPYVADIAPKTGNFLVAIFPSLDNLIQKISAFLQGLGN